MHGFGPSTEVCLVYQWPHSWKKSDPFFLSSHQLAIVPQLGACHPEPVVIPYWNFQLSWPCVGSEHCCEFLCWAARLCPGDNISQHSSPSPTSYILLHSSLGSSLSCEGARFLQSVAILSKWSGVWEKHTAYFNRKLPWLRDKSRRKLSVPGAWVLSLTQFKEYDYSYFICRTETEL